jgi:hypothetical protein
MDRSLDRLELRNRAGAWAPTAQDQLSVEARVMAYFHYSLSLPSKFRETTALTFRDV